MWISQLVSGGSIIVDMRGSLNGSLARLTAVDDTVEGSFLNLPGAFMPMRTRLDSSHRDGEIWSHVFDQRNPQRGTTLIDPGLIADNRSLRFMAQLHLAGRRLRGFLRSPDSARNYPGYCTDGSWFTTNLRSDRDGLFVVAQGGPQRLWDTVECSYVSWRRLGEPSIEKFGITAPDDPALQYVWFDKSDSRYRWPLPM
jgi:hypothetical protein